MLWIASQTIWLPDAIKALIEILLRIRLAPPPVCPNVVAQQTGNAGVQRRNCRSEAFAKYAKASLRQLRPAGTPR